MSNDHEWKTAADLQKMKPGDFPPPRYTKAEVAALKKHATQIAAPPAYRCDDRVAVRGEALSLPIFWQGRQWAVTSYGVECRDGTYFIEKERLSEDEGEFGWVRHLSEKIWIDLPDFAEALRLARASHNRTNGARKRS